MRRSSTRAAAATAPTMPADGALARLSSRLIGGRPVACRGFERDRFGRLLATCEVNGADLNEAQVAAGWAVAYGGYEAVEAEARAGTPRTLGRHVRATARLARVHGDARDEPADWPSWLLNGSAACFGFPEMPILSRQRCGG